MFMYYYGSVVLQHLELCSQTMFYCPLFENAVVHLYNDIGGFLRSLSFVLSPRPFI